MKRVYRMAVGNWKRMDEDEDGKTIQQTEICLPYAGYTEHTIHTYTLARTALQVRNLKLYVLFTQADGENFDSVTVENGVVSNSKPTVYSRLR